MKGFAKKVFGNSAFVSIFALALLVLFLVFGCTAQGPIPGDGNFGGKFPGPRGGDGNGMPGDFNAPPGVFDGPDRGPTDFNFYLIKEKLGLDQAASMADIVSALGLPLDANQQQVMETIKDKFGFIGGNIQ